MTIQKLNVHRFGILIYTDLFSYVHRFGILMQNKKKLSPFEKFFSSQIFELLQSKLKGLKKSKKSIDVFTCLQIYIQSRIFYKIDQNSGLTVYVQQITAFIILNIKSL